MPDKPPMPGQPGYDPSRWQTWIDLLIDERLPEVPKTLRDAMYDAACTWQGHRERQADDH